MRREEKIKDKSKKIKVEELKISNLEPDA